LQCKRFHLFLYTFLPHLSHFCPMFNPFNGHRCQLVGTVMGFSGMVLGGGCWPPGERTLRVKPWAKTCSCKLQKICQSSDYKRGTVIRLFATLLWSLLASWTGVCNRHLLCMLLRCSDAAADSELVIVGDHWWCCCYSNIVTDTVCDGLQPWLGERTSPFLASNCLSLLLAWYLHWLQ